MLLQPKIFLAGALSFVLALGCSTVNPSQLNNHGSHISVLIQDVPFVKQKDDFCGPSAMASVTGYYGTPLTQDKIAEKVYTPALKGALISDMENFAREQGYNANTQNGSLDRIKTLIDNGKPVILLVDRGAWKLSVPHYYVVYGYVNGGDAFIIHTGDREGVEIESSKLDSEWGKMNRLMLVIEP